MDIGLNTLWRANLHSKNGLVKNGLDNYQNKHGWRRNLGEMTHFNTIHSESGVISQQAQRGAPPCGILLQLWSIGWFTYFVGPWLPENWPIPFSFRKRCENPMLRPKESHHQSGYVWKWGMPKNCTFHKKKLPSFLPSDFGGVPVIFRETQTGWWFQPLWKIWKAVGIAIPNIWKNKKWSKSPTRNAKSFPFRNEMANGLPNSIHKSGRG
jgi:hypothetical protein